MICYDVKTGERVDDLYNPTKLSAIKRLQLPFVGNLKRSKYFEHSDGSISVFDAIDYTHYGLNYIPYEFRYVVGGFDISYNDLQSLRGCPMYIQGTFDCCYNKLESLEGSPIVSRTNYISGNRFKDLKYIPISTINNYIYDNLARDDRLTHISYFRNVNRLIHW